jgi:DNA-binding beta-propeller fold protein YncE
VNVRRRLFALALLALAGCASEPRVLELEGEAAAPQLFPQPQSGETPRYRYLGQLRGESNLRAKDPGTRRTGRRLLAWIVGLDEEREQPVRLARPVSGTVDAAGRILVTDAGRGAVYVFDEAGGKLEVWDKASPRQRFAAPTGIALGADGELLVSDADLGRVFRLGPDGSPRGEFGAGLLRRPTGLARDTRSGRVFVADSQAHVIQVFDAQGALQATWGRRGEGPGEFNYPTHLAFADGLLLVSDALNARVQVLDGEGRPVLRFGERGLFVGNLVRPKGVAADAEGNLYVVESMHDALLVYDRAGRFLMALDGSGGEGGRFYLPAGVWIDARNRVFVADMFNGRVAVFQFLGGR